MYEVIVENKGVEYVAYTAENQREAELVRQRHARSLAEGTAYIREAKK